MSTTTSENTRNFAVIAHGGAGKSLLIETMLVNAKVLSRAGSLDKGDLAMITEPEEIERQMQVTPHLAHFSVDHLSFNLVSCPGYFNFLESSRAVLPGVDGALVVFSGVDGIRPETRRLWTMLEEAGVPTIGFINELEDEQANLEAALSKIEDGLGKTVLPVNLPIGSGPDLSGVIELINGQAWESKDGKSKKIDVPADQQDQVEEYRSKLIEQLAETKDELIEKFLEGEELTEDELSEALKLSVAERSFIPVLCGSAAMNVGVVELVKALEVYLPSPKEREEKRPWTGVDAGGEVITRSIDDGTFAAQVLKTTIDPFSGKVSIIRVISGSVENGQALYNSTKSRKEKAGHIYLVQGKELEQVESLTAGQIGAISKLDETATRDTLCDPKEEVRFPAIDFHAPQVFLAVKAEKKGEEKVGTGLARLVEEDPTLRLFRDPQTKENILAGMGQAHIEVAMARLERKFGAKANLQVPEVPYRETIRKKVEVEGKLKKQSGGHGQFAKCVITAEGIARDKGFLFEDLITGGVIPKQFIPSVEKGVQEAMKAGILGGYPVVDVKVALIDGQYHAVDSSDYAFQVAGSFAFKSAMEQADPVLLEPIVSMVITVPEDNTGDVMKDLSSRRGKVLGMDSERGLQVIRAEVPQPEVLEYGGVLGAITSGQGLYSMELSTYAEVPAQIAGKILEIRKKAQEEEKKS